jgi:Holliday junction resolvase RusA-like endonuclease
MIAFFVACVPPKANHQRKRIVRIGNFTKLADKPELVAAKAMLDSVLLPYQPHAPVDGPVRLVVEFTWPWRKSESKRTRALGRIPHTTKPDCSNALKTLEDRLVALRFIEDDSRVVDVTVRKFFGDTPGIRVLIERVLAVGVPAVCVNHEARTA